MKRFKTGDQVRIDIPDETDPDHPRPHGSQGTVVEIIQDDAGSVTGDSREGYLFRVELEDGEQMSPCSCPRPPMAGTEIYHSGAVALPVSPTPDGFCGSSTWIQV